MNILRKYITWRNRCRTCETSGIYGDCITQFPELAEIEALKFGHLYQCSKCDQYWFYHSNKSWLYRIHQDHLPLVHHWNKGSFACNDDTITILSGIKGVVDLCYEHISIPCSVKHKSGVLYDKSVVMIAKHPPYSWPEPHKVFWGEDILSVSGEY